jgi:hypothetical protein
MTGNERAAFERVISVSYATRYQSELPSVPSPHLMKSGLDCLPFHLPKNLWKFGQFMARRRRLGAPLRTAGKQMHMLAFNIVPKVFSNSNMQPSLQSEMQRQTCGFRYGDLQPRPHRQKVYSALDAASASGSDEDEDATSSRKRKRPMSVSYAAQLSSGMLWT